LDFSDFFEVTSGKIPLNELEDAKLALSPGFRLHHNSIERKVKGILDWLLATIVLFLTLPILALTTLLILIFDGRPVFYTQNRVGLNGEIFKILKFRSMKKDAEKVGGVQFAKENDDRITKIGRLIRGTRIDELPQLINILRGEMSFIGPRPERPELVEVYNKQIPYYELRHTVKAGLTGWAQVMYKYGNSNDDTVEKLQYELYYIKNYSLFLDFQILLKTLSVVFFRRGL
jgi:exopolysaccharide biosynthesis polyprenyl glycosylphosphotransferase